MGMTPRTYTGSPGIPKVRVQVLSSKNTIECIKENLEDMEFSVEYMRMIS